MHFDSSDGKQEQKCLPLYGSLNVFFFKLYVDYGWSRPSILIVKIKHSVKNKVFFGGGAGKYRFFYILAHF